MASTPIGGPGHSPRRISVADPLAHELLIGALMQNLPSKGKVTIMCIGTDRSTGDAYGPVTGSILSGCDMPDRYRVLGTLESPVHAGNLEDIVSLTRGDYVIALDACLGSPESIGVIEAGCGPLRPGAGVNKSLPAIGDVYLTAVVNVGGFMEYFVLQNTRLNIVMQLANLTASSIYQSIMRKEELIGGGNIDARTETAAGSSKRSSTLSNWFAALRSRW